MRHKVAELEGALIDTAVAKAEAIETIEGPNDWLSSWDADHGCWRGWSPSRDWRVGGPIIERERIAFQGESYWESGTFGWLATVIGGRSERGSTHLIAAMRAYVASKFGDEVEL